LGDVYIMAYIDKDGDGPSEGEPAAATRHTIAVGDQNISGIHLLIVDKPEIGHLTPSTTPHIKDKGHHGT
jgi:hypothetical protein